MIARLDIAIKFVTVAANVQAAKIAVGVKFQGHEICVVMSVAKFIIKI